ncbi:Protein priB [Penicillium rolfsii]|nr:Protein priB [Penicillium rolfsii]
MTGSESNGLKSPTAVACLTCRRAKMKCVMPAGQSRCIRCRRWDTDCVFEAHKRGQWRREARKCTTRAMSQNKGCASSTESSLSSPSIYLVDHDEFELPHDTTPTNHPDRSFEIPSFVGHKEDTRVLSFHRILEESRGLPGRSSTGLSRETPQAITTRLSDDPIEMGILNLPAAENLFDCFFKHFNYLVGALDPELFTFHYTRAVSPFLFTAVLCIASRVFRPELHQPLKEHTEMQLSRVLINCDPSIENIWAIICINHWKDIRDRRGYNLIGFALRLASSASWHKDWEDAFNVRQDTLTRNRKEDIFETRRRRDRERIWLVLGNQDRSASFFASRPLSAALIDGGAASREWLTLDQCSFPHGDSTAIAGNELNKLCRPVYEFVIKTKGYEEDAIQLGSFDVNDDQFEGLIDVFNAKVSEWGNTWGPIYAGYTQTQPCLESLVYIYAEHSRLYFNSIRLHRMLLYIRHTRRDSRVKALIQTCYSSAMRLLQETLKVVKLDILYFLWDTAHLMIAFAAMMLLKILQLARRHDPYGFVESAVPFSREILTNLANSYSKAAHSLMPQSAPGTETNLSDGESQVNTIPIPLEAQARLLRGILVRMHSSILSKAIGPPEQALQTDHLVSVNTDQVAGPSLLLNLPSNTLGIGHVNVDEVTPSRSAHDDIDGILNHVETSQQDLNFDFVNRRFEEAGLVFWDESCIFGLSQ